jgi:stress-induced morphogen
MQKEKSRLSCLRSIVSEKILKSIEKYRRVIFPLEKREIITVNIVQNDFADLSMVSVERLIQRILKKLIQMISNMENESANYSVKIISNIQLYFLEHKIISMTNLNFKKKESKSSDFFSLYTSIKVIRKID